MAVKATEPKKAKNGYQGAEIFTCTCDHVFQDQEYGRKRRVHNGCSAGYKCTVCGNLIKK